MNQSPAPTLVLHPRCDEDSQLLWQAAVDQGWPTIRAGFGETFPLQAEGPFVVYGGTLWADDTARRLGLRDAERVSDRWLLDLPNRFLRRWLTIGNANQCRYPIFIKAINSKAICSRVYHSADDLPLGLADDTSIRLLVSEPVRFEVEYRAFLLDKSVATICRYASNGELDVAQTPGDQCAREAQAFTHTLSRYLPTCNLVVDVGLIAGRGWAVVEGNTAWQSGLYACDPRAALRVIAACFGVRV